MYPAFEVLLYYNLLFPTSGRLEKLFVPLFVARRRFWGPRCDVRRFQDGRMQHCVLWKAFTAFEGPAALERLASREEEYQTPPEQIVWTVLTRHAAEICMFTPSSSKAEDGDGTAEGKKAVQKQSLDVCCSPLGANAPLLERQKALIRVGPHR